MMQRVRLSLILAFAGLLYGCSYTSATMEHLPPVLGNVMVTLSQSYAVFNCKVEGDLGSIASCGFEISSTSEPPLVQLAANVLDSSITAFFEGLSPKTEYEVIAFIDNGKSRVFSERVPFITGDFPVNKTIYFEDKEFENYLLRKFDTDHDGKISESEALNVTELYSLPGNIKSLKGIEFFKNLSDLSTPYCQIEYLDVSANKNLCYLDCSYCKLNTLIISGLSNLARLHCNDNSLTSIDLTGCSALEWIVCCRNRIPTLDISPCSQKISILHCEPMNDSYGNNILKTVYVSKSQIVPRDQLPSQTTVSIKND